MKRPFWETDCCNSDLHRFIESEHILQHSESEPHTLFWIINLIKQNKLRENFIKALSDKTLHTHLFLLEKIVAFPFLESGFAVVHEAGR